MLHQRLCLITTAELAARIVVEFHLITQVYVGFTILNVFVLIDPNQSMKSLGAESSCKTSSNREFGWNW